MVADEVLRRERAQSLLGLCVRHNTQQSQDTPPGNLLQFVYLRRQALVQEADGGGRIAVVPGPQPQSASCPRNRLASLAQRDCFRHNLIER